MAHWQELAGQLAENLPVEIESRWREAVAIVPRHVLVPSFKLIDIEEGSVEWVAAVDALDSAYRDERLYLGTGRRFLDSRAPSVTAQLFQELDIRPGQRVLEVRSDQGYSTALLAQVLGDDACCPPLVLHTTAPFAVHMSS